MNLRATKRIYNLSNFIRYFIGFIVVVALLIGCGGGGGGGSSSSVGAGAKGVGAKGPFKQGSTVIAYKLNADGSRSTTSKQTSITDDIGHFNFATSLPWTGATEFIVSGKYLNENTGAYIELPKTKGLSAIIDIESSITKTVNINIFTDMATKIIKRSMSNGSTFENAKKEAQSSIKKLFNLSDDVILEKLDLTDGLNSTQDNTKLLLISSALLKTSDPMQTLKNLEDDLKDDDKIDSTNGLISLNELKIRAKQVDIHAISTTLKNADIGVDNPPCEDINEDIINTPVHVYGERGIYPVSQHDEVDTNMTTAYCPVGIPNDIKIPVIFFASGYNSTDSNDYKSLLTFIASQGYCVIYAKQNIHGWNDLFTNFDKMLDSTNAILPKLDTTRIGIVGHSLGGGYAFSILKHFSDKGYGTNGRFIMVLEGYYAYNLTKQDMQNLPSNTNVVMQQYGVGGNNAINDTDPRITLTEFYMLDSIPKNQKDWQIVENADHHYPMGDKPYTQMQGILKPLDALMDYTFNATALAHDRALEVVSDDPYAHGNGIQKVKPIDEYSYKCDHDINVAIDYCDMAQWYSNKQLILHQKGHWLPMMADNFASRADYINTLPFSGFTMVGNTYTDIVMESNTTLLPYSYIWNEVKNVKDLYPTKSNFLTVNMHFPGDFWDDAIWNNVIANFATLARVAKNLGFRGIIYDDEPYDAQSHKMINYKHDNAWYDNNAYKNPNYTFKEHSDKITERFKQIMEAMIREYPAIDVLYYHSPVEGHIKADNGINGHPVVVDVGLEREHEFTGAMFVGFKEGLSHQAELHDMGEDYRLRTQTHFDDAYEWRKHTISYDMTNDVVDDTQHWIVPLEERVSWDKEISVDFMVSNEPLNSEYEEFNTTDRVGLADIKTTLERALDKSDKYVIFYSASSSDNQGGLISLDWLNNPSSLTDDGVTHYSLDPNWKNMMKDVYNNKVLK